MKTFTLSALFATLLVSPSWSKDLSLLRGYFQGTVTYHTYGAGEPLTYRTPVYHFSASREQAKLTTIYRGLGRRWAFRNSDFYYTDWDAYTDGNFKGVATFGKRSIRFNSRMHGNNRMKGLIRWDYTSVVISSTYTYYDGSIFKLVFRLNKVEQGAAANP